MVFSLSGRGLDGPRVPPVSGTAEQLVVFLHGYGSNGDDLIALARPWAQLLPKAAFVSPNAPEPVPGAPFGFQWFEITRLDPAAMVRGVERAAPVLNAFLDSELKRHNLTAANLALVGFSQGTMMALHAGLRRPEPVAAIVGYSGLLAGPEKLETELAAKPPVLLVHGDADQMIPVSAMHVAAGALAKAGVSVRDQTVSELAFAEAEDALDFVALDLTVDKGDWPYDPEE